MVAVALMGMVEVAVDEIVNVISVRNRFMPAIRSVSVAALMTCAAVIRSAVAGVAVIDVKLVLVVVIIVGVVKVAVVEVVDVVLVLDSRVPAVGAVLMLVGAVNIVAHDTFPLDPILNKGF